MTPWQKKVSKYLVKSITDGATISPDHKSILTAIGRPLSETEVKDGIVFPFDTFAWESGMMTNSSGKRREMIVFPRVYVQRVVDNVRNSLLADLVIPLGVKVVVDERGHLEPGDCPPWVPREHVGEHEGTHISLIDQFVIDDFYTNNPYEAVKNWQELVTYAIGLLKVVMEGYHVYPGIAGIATNALDAHYMDSSKMAAVFVDTPTGATESIVKILQIISSGKAEAALTLFNELIERTPKTKQSAFSNQGLFPENAGAHVAQMTSGFGLSEKQRNALAYQAAMGEGEILPVNGPPGTGKTTLIRSVVANEWTRAAAQGLSAPIIFASSSNNQAVTNIIDCFGDSDERSVPESVRGRWIPGVSSYGVYICAQSKVGEAERNGLIYHTTDGQGSQVAWHDSAFLGAAEVAFIEHAMKWKIFPTTPTLMKVRDMLRAELKSVVQQIEDKLKQIKNYKKLSEAVAGAGGPDKARLKAEELIRQRETIRTRASNLSNLRQSFWTHLEGRDLLLRYLTWIPFFDRKDQSRNDLFLSSMGIKWSKGLRAKDIWKEIESALSRQQDEINVIDKELAPLSAALASIETAFIEVSKAFPKELDREELKDPITAWQQRLDTEDRVLAFKLATHYWEACWLLEAKKTPDLIAENKKSPWAIQQRLQRMAMLTPCFVSTFYTMAGFLTGYSKTDAHWKPSPLFDTVDLLIIDEAGQALTSIAAASFALSKKALVVGDVFQIDPVWNIPESIDRANLKACSLFINDEDYRGYWANSGLMSSQGSLMQATQSRTPLHQCPELSQGLYLTEHRRCYDSIIRYCNEVVYKGVLEPMRGNPGDSAETEDVTMEFIHVEGDSERNGSSRFNRHQASFIAHWIERNQAEIIELISKTMKVVDEKDAICQRVAVVTPFKAQSEMIKRELRKYKLDAMTVGTTHALQGAERSIILFSSVYGVSDKGAKKFYENGSNLLNVAVSRAKDRFIVFGHNEVFGASPADRYSYALRQYLHERHGLMSAA